MLLRVLINLGILIAFKCFSSSCLEVGIGIADVTGPPAEVIFMGYANFEQSGSGLHLRQYARAFIFKNDESRVVFVSVDAAMMGIGIKKEVIRKLNKYYGDIYNDHNIILSGTHTHSTAGGFLLDFLFDLPILGFVRETFNAYVQGIVKSIKRAHESMRPALIFYGETEILEANINRSPNAYLRNPKEERSQYQYDVDKTLVQLKITSDTDVNDIIGVINWFPVHPTSMNNTNRLVSSDNVGYASLLLENALNKPGFRTGKPKVICAFASTNLGDVSPNIMGPKCEYSRKPCDNQFQLCDQNEKCFASGPGANMFESTKIIATRMYEKALSLLSSNTEAVSGSINIVQQYVFMPNMSGLSYDPVSKSFNQNKTVSGCLPAMGYSFAAGTTDGPGSFDFTQGTTSGNELWNAVRDFIAKPTNEDVTCQAPKPILFATGRIKFPYEWQPNIVSCSVARIGHVILAAVPGEFTTMSGRRLRHVIGKVTEKRGLTSRVIIAGLSNVYSDYITTYEEYQAQRYEAASTIYGPHTLELYLNKYKELTEYMMTNETPDNGPEPDVHFDNLISLVTPVLWDTAPWGKEFGDCIVQPARKYKRGQIARAIFVAGHPRNNILHDKTYLTIEKLISTEEDKWTVVATDADWETKFIWHRIKKILGTSNAEILWDIPLNTERGFYRIHHYGTYKYTFGGLYPYEGFSNEFQVV